MARAPASLLAAMLLVRLADEWYSFLPVGAINPIRDDLGLTYAQVGVVLIALPLGGIVGHGFTIAADFMSRRLISSFGAYLVAACMLAFALADSFWVLLVAGFTWGAATDAFVHGCEVALVDLYRDDLAPVLARVNAFAAVGDLLGPLTLIAAATAGIDWRLVFVAGAAAMCAYGAWLATQPFPPPRPPEHARTPIPGVLSVLRDARVVLFALLHGLFGLLDEPFLGFTLAYLHDVRGLPDAASNAIAGAAIVGGLAGFLTVGTLTSRLPPRPLMIVTSAAAGTGIVMIILLPFAPAQGVAAFAFGYAGAAFYAVLQASYLSLRPGQAGTTGAVVSTIGLAGVGYPVLVGAVSDVWGLTAGLALYAFVPAVMLAILLATRIAADTRVEAVPA